MQKNSPNIGNMLNNNINNNQMGNNNINNNMNSNNVEKNNQTNNNANGNSFVNNNNCNINQEIQNNIVQNPNNQEKNIKASSINNIILDKEDLNLKKEEDNKSNVLSNDSEIRIKKLNKHTPNIPETTFFCKVESSPQAFDKNEINEIRSIIETFYTSFNIKSSDSISELISDAIKNKLGGEWFVIAQSLDQKLSFIISSVSDSDIIEFKIGNSKFKVAKIR